MAMDFVLVQKGQWRLRALAWQLHAHVCLICANYMATAVLKGVPGYAGAQRSDARPDGAGRRLAPAGCGVHIHGARVAACGQRLQRAGATPLQGQMWKLHSPAENIHWCWSRYGPPQVCTHGTELQQYVQQDQRHRCRPQNPVIRSVEPGTVQTSPTVLIKWGNACAQKYGPGALKGMLAWLRHLAAAVGTAQILTEALDNDCEEAQEYQQARSAAKPEHR